MSRLEQAVAAAEAPVPMKLRRVNIGLLGDRAAVLILPADASDAELLAIANAVTGEVRVVSRAEENPTIGRIVVPGRPA